MSGRLSDETIARHAYAAGFRGESLVVAVAVALAESGGRPRARGDVGLQDGKWGPSIGLWQIRSLRADHGTGRQRDARANLDPATNARHAFQISGHGHNWHPWTTYTTGSYRAFLDRARTAARSAGRDGQHGHSGGNGHHRPDHGRRSGGGRIVLDLNELARLETLMDSGRARVEHSQRVLGDVAADLRLTAAAPSYAQYLNGLFTALTGPYGLPMVAQHLDWELHLVQRTRRLAAAAVGPDKRHGPEDLIPFLQRLGNHIGLPEVAVLEALIAGGLRTRHRSSRPGGPRVPALPPHPRMNHGDIVPAALRRYGNGHLPAGRLTSVGEGEKLADVAAKHFRRMDAAARADGVDLRMVSGYRSYAEQSRLYDLYRSGRGNLAAPPGRSNHGWGLSADIDVRGEPRASTWLRAHAGRFGFFNDVPGEPWHWTYRPR